MTNSASKAIKNIQNKLWDAYGPQEWWPADTTTEMVVGAILTQNTSWTNVERAIDNLKDADALSWPALHGLALNDLAELIKPAGTFRVKAARLKAFTTVLWDDHAGSLDSLMGGDTESARRRLLSIHGIGPETADAILLYAGSRPTFVVDAYTKRVLRRHHVISPAADYDTVQRLFHEVIEPDPQVYNEYHALLVAVGKKHCQARARCEGCPLDTLHHDPAL